jgi:hypothetical protein
VGGGSEVAAAIVDVQHNATYHQAIWKVSCMVYTVALV